MPDALSFDPAAFELRRNGEVVELEPQAVTLAAYLIEHRHRLISKEELLDEVWGGRFVGESALTTRIKQIRRVLGDDGTEQQIVKTVYGKGYRFVGTIEIADNGAPGSGAPAAIEGEPADRANHNLPRLREGVVGRAAALADAVETVGQHRVTTMVGVGGVGKTTLAVAVGHELLESFPDGVWFVDLVAVSDGEQVPIAIAQATGLGLQPGPVLDQIGRILADREMLVVVDNCEHVIDAVTSTVDHLLDVTTGPRFLLTSREPSGLLDEHRFAVEPLASSAGDGPAVELLETCVSRFGVAIVDREKAAGVCRELDGLPLAIELAAAQLRHLSLDDLAARLDQRFELLVDPRQDRHSSLTAVLDATWSSIAEDERELLRQFAQCPGPLGLDALIELVDGPEHGTIAAIGRLVDCSLLTRSADHDGAYRMLETVRAYASTDDDRVDERRDRLANWCLGHVGSDAVRQTFDFGLVKWCRAHDAVLDAAEVHLGAARPADAARLVAAQGLTAHVDDGSRAAQLLGRIETHLDRVDDPGLRAQLHITGAFGSMAVRDPALLATHGSEAVREARLADDPSVLAISLVLESWAYVRDPVHAIALVTEAGDIARAAGDQRSLDLAEGYRAWHLAMMRHYDQAIEVADAVVERSPDDAGYDTACAGSALASCLALRDPQHALRVVEIYVMRIGFWSMLANRMPGPPAQFGPPLSDAMLLASIHAALGDAAATARIVVSAHRRLDRAGQHAFPDALVPIATLAIARGDDERARSYVSAVRRSSRPTQSLQVTCLYQQLRSHFEDAGGLGDDDTAPDQVARDALEWLGAQVGSD